jgi:hypothetical protein
VGGERFHRSCLLSVFFKVRVLQIPLRIPPLRRSDRSHGLMAHAR